MTNEMLLTIFEKVASPLLVGIILFVFEKRREKRDKMAAETEKKKRINERIQITLLVATAKLCLAAALSIRNHNPTPDLAEKTERLEEAMENFKAFERELVADTRLEV